MSSLREAASLCEAAVYDVLKYADQIEGGPERRRVLEQEVARLDAYAEVQPKVNEVKAELTRVSADLQQKKRILDDLKARSTEDLSQKCAAAQAELNDLQACITKANAELRAVDESFGSLHKRLNLS